MITIAMENMNNMTVDITIMEITNAVTEVTAITEKLTKALVTTLVAKDRVLAHNPVGALYQAKSYYKKLMTEQEKNGKNRYSRKKHNNDQEPCS